LDLLYGILSIVDQFGGILRERGHEYRKTREGRRLGVHLEGMYRELGQRERKALDVIVSSLDELAQTIRHVESSLDGNGAPDKSRRKGKRK
jgi:hypothetical protein